MRGVGGPLLSIGDLLSDLGEESGESPDHNGSHAPSSPPPQWSISNSNDVTPHSLDLTRLFQENYNKLNEAFSGSGHSWTALTLELCTALETANKLVGSTNTSARLLLEKVEELEKTVKRGDSTVAAARALHATLNQTGRPPDASDRSI